MEDKERIARVMEAVTSPVKGRIIMEVTRRGRATAGDVSERCPEIPRTTLYRNLGRLVEDGILEVAGERPVRGTVERTYALAFEPDDPEALLGGNSGAAYMQAFARYLLTFATLFRDFCSQPGADPAGSGSGFTLSHVYATDEEIEEAARKVAETLYPLQGNGPAPGRKLRTVGLIVSPEHAERS